MKLKFMLSKLRVKLPPISRAMHTFPACGSIEAVWTNALKSIKFVDAGAAMKTRIGKAFIHFCEQGFIDCVSKRLLTKIYVHLRQEKLVSNFDHLLVLYVLAAMSCNEAI